MNLRGPFVHFFECDVRSMVDLVLYEYVSLSSDIDRPFSHFVVGRDIVRPVLRSLYNLERVL